MEAYPYLKAGNLELQFQTGAGVGLWGTNVAELEITTSGRTVYAPDGLQSWKVSDTDIMKAKCTLAGGAGVTFGTSQGGLALDFSSIVSNAEDSARWWCDIAVGSTFRAAEAKYTLVAKNAVTGDDTHPDDNEPMSSWGSDATGHSGYFSFGTPGEILDAGGYLGGNVETGTLTFQYGAARPLRRHRSRALVTRLAPGTVNPGSSTIRFGFCQSATAEAFSIQDIDITLYASAKARCKVDGTWDLTGAC